MDNNLDEFEKIRENLINELVENTDVYLNFPTLRHI